MIYEWKLPYEGSKWGNVLKISKRKPKGIKLVHEIEYIANMKNQVYEIEDASLIWEN